MIGHEDKSVILDPGMFDGFGEPGADDVVYCLGKSFRCHVRFIGLTVSPGFDFFDEFREPFGVTFGDAGVALKSSFIARPSSIVPRFQSAWRGEGVEQKLFVDRTCTAFVRLIGEVTADGPGHRGKSDGYGQGAARSASAAE